LEGTSPKTVPDLVAHIGVLFTDGRRGVILSTIHKAKGLEAERVYFLDRFLIPSKYARKGWQREQEQNLLYVALTRSKNFLYFINSTGFTSTHLYDKKASAGQLGLF
jgi:superfamily I DNA/RNA helicase